MISKPLFKTHKKERLVIKIKKQALKKTQNPPLSNKSNPGHNVSPNTHARGVP
jgi:hypothetical protein